MELGVICEAVEMDIDFMKDIAKGEKVGDKKQQLEDSLLLLLLIIVSSSSPSS